MVGKALVSRNPVYWWNSFVASQNLQNLVFFVQACDREKVKKVIVEQEIRFSLSCESNLYFRHNLVLLCHQIKPEGQKEKRTKSPLLTTSVFLWYCEWRRQDNADSSQDISILERLELYFSCVGVSAFELAICRDSNLLKLFLLWDISITVWEPNQSSNLQRKFRCSATLFYRRYDAYLENNLRSNVNKSSEYF